MARIENPLLLIIRVWVLFQLHRLDDIFRSNYFVIISSISPIYCTSCSSTLLSHKPKAKTHLSFYCLQFFLILLTLPIYLPSFHSNQWPKWHSEHRVPEQSYLIPYHPLHCFHRLWTNLHVQSWKIKKTILMRNTLVVSLCLHTIFEPTNHHNLCITPYTPLFTFVYQNHFYNFNYDVDQFFASNIILNRFV